jgi:hypothetical protein
MKEIDSTDQLMETFLQSEWDKKEIKQTVKKKQLIALLLHLKSIYINQQSLIKDVEHHLQELLKTISGFNVKGKDKQPKEKKESFINEKVLRKSLDVLEEDNKIEREILAIGEHYKVDIFKLIWKKHFIRHFYLSLSKKMKKSGFHDYKLNWERINILIKHQGKPIEETKGEISPKKLKKIKSLVSETLK